MANQGYIKLARSEQVEWLLVNHPNAFLLLTVIALRARRTSNSPDGFEIGECHIGDFLNCGIATERKYRTAKKLLCELKIIKICETCRNRKKTTTETTTKTTTRGTKVKLLGSDFWDINCEKEKIIEISQTTTETTTERRPSDDEQECKKLRKKESYNHSVINNNIQDSRVRDVVVSDKKSEKEKKVNVNSLTKEDVYANNLRSSLGWEPDEIEEAWEISQKCKSPISDLLSYIQGIINNKRVLKQAKERKECQTYSKSAKQTKTLKNRCTQKEATKVSSKKSFAIRKGAGLAKDMSEQHSVL